MNKLAWMAAATALGLSACASSGMHEGMVYRDGSWYSPAGDGRGDYYTASPRSPDAWDYPFDFSIGMLPYGGYCPVRYRYCTSFWADPWNGGYYDAYWYQPWQHHRSSHHHHAPQPIAGIELADEPESAPTAREPRERPTPRSWEERPVHTPRVREGGDSPRPRRRGPMNGGGSR